MAHVRQLASGNWRCEYRDPAGDRHGMTFRTKAAAEAWGDDREHDLRHGSWIDPRAGEQTVRDFAPRWLASRVTENHTAADNRWRLDRHVLPYWGDRQLASIRPLEVQAWVAQLAGPLSSSSVRKLYYLLAGILDAAVRDGAIAMSPCRGIELPPVAKSGSEMFYTHVEIDRLLTLTAEQVDARRPKPMPGLLEAWPMHRLALRFLAFTGVRWGELAGLHVDRLDLLRRRVDVIDVAAEDELKPYPKSRRSRTVPLDPTLCAELAAHLAARPPLAPCGLTHRRKGRCAGVVFHYDGRTLNRSTFGRYVWHPARVAAGLDYGRPHDLRHTYASWLVQAGQPLAVVQALLGHHSVTMTERYSHLAPDATLDESIVGALVDGARRASDVRQQNAETGQAGPGAAVITLQDRRNRKRLV